MSYPLSTPTPTGLAPLNNHVAKAQVAQFIDGSQTALLGGLDTALDTVASSGKAPGSAVVWEASTE